MSLSAISLWAFTRGRATGSGGSGAPTRAFMARASCGLDTSRAGALGARLNASLAPLAGHPAVREVRSVLRVVAEE